MASEQYRGRRAAVIENDALRVTVLQGGGHIAEVFDKSTGVNPLWTPKWSSVEPADFDSARHVEYGTGSEARLLAGIMGHNLCLDIFGGPSAEEERAGLSAHGEAPIVRWDVDVDRDRTSLVMHADLTSAQLQVERRLQLHGRAVAIQESVENLTSCDRPVGWTQHVTLGPPFLQQGATELRASATRSKVYERQFGPDDYLVPGAEFDWPRAPRSAGGYADLRVFSDARASSAYTTHLLDTRASRAFFLAWSPDVRLAFGYVWRPVDFPWLGIWEENCSRTHSPWNGQSITCGMEFGVSPIPESRREMIDRGRLFGVPTFRWIPAKTRVDVEYWIVLRAATAVPETLEWPDPI